MCASSSPLRRQIPASSTSPCPASAALRISSAQRVPSATDTPTVAEQGLPGFETGSFQGVVGPAGIARETVARLNGEFGRVLALPEMKERFAKQGTEVRS